MALSRGYAHEIPKDAIVITEDEAAKYQWDIISKWKKTSEVWSLQYSPVIVALFATGTSIFINDHFRTKLRLGQYGRFSTYLPIVVIPSIFTILYHKFFVQRSIMLRPMEDCPMCLQLRAAAFQIGFGVVYPSILAPLAACMFATRHFTYRLPSITQKPLEVLQLIRKFTKPIVPTLGTIIIGQSLLTIYLTYKQQQQSMNILINMRKLEQHAEEQLRH